MEQLEAAAVNCGSTMASLARTSSVGHAQAEEVIKMALTRDFTRTIVERVQRDPEFARAFLDEAATLFLNGEADAARLVLRDLVNATVGFEVLAAEMAKPAKSLHRMLSKNGNPTMDNLAAILGVVSQEAGRRTACTHR